MDIDPRKIAYPPSTGVRRIHATPLVTATAASLAGYGRLVDDPKTFPIEIVRWPAQGWRPIDENSGDQGGVVEGLFEFCWKGEKRWCRSTTRRSFWTARVASTRASRSTSSRSSAATWALRCHARGRNHDARLPARRSALRQDRAPIDDRVPQHALIAAIQIAMQRVEVERDHVAQTGAQIENRGAADEVVFSPRLTAHDQRRTFAIAPFEHHAARIERTIQTGRAVRHAQPAARGGIERKVLAEHVGARGVTVSDRVIGSRE